MAQKQVNLNQDDDAHIPESLRDPVLKMTSENAYTGCLPTVFIGIVDSDYTEDMWNNHATRLSKLFNISQQTGFIEIKVRNRGDDQVDAVQLGRDMSAAIDALSSANVDIIRIVGMGIHGAIAVHEAIESLVRGWNKTWTDKNVQFVALGDAKDSVYLKLCKRMCLKNVCASVQFYLTMDYNNFGFLDFDKRNLSEMSPEKLAKLLEKLQAKQQLKKK